MVLTWLVTMHLSVIGGKTLQSRVISEQGQKTVKRVTHGLKFAAKVYKPPPCVGAVCHVSGDRLTPVEPRQVLVWKAGRACVANDPREDFGLRRPSSGTSTPLASCASSPTTRPSKHAQTFLPGPIHEEGDCHINSHIFIPLCDVLSVYVREY